MIKRNKKIMSKDKIIRQHSRMEDRKAKKTLLLTVFKVVTII